MADGLLIQEDKGVLSGLGVPPGAFAALRDILLDIRSANRRVNLVAGDSGAELRLHLLDSIQALADPAASTEAARVIDVGTGGGFPGLPLLIARPGWRGTLVDAVRKKANALSDILARRTGGRGEALWGRAETLAREEGRRDVYDLAFCRAVGRFSTVMELTLPFLKPGGVLLAHRGHEAPAEAEGGRAAAEALGGRIEELTPYHLPSLDKTRYIVRVVKVSATPPAYPRRDGVPAKRPL